MPKSYGVGLSDLCDMAKHERLTQRGMPLIKRCLEHAGSGVIVGALLYSAVQSDPQALILSFPLSGLAWYAHQRARGYNDSGLKRHQFVLGVNPIRMYLTAGSELIGCLAAISTLGSYLE